MHAEIPQHIALSHESGIVTIVLDRPAEGNVLDLPMCQQLSASLKEARATPALRLVVLRARGRHFSVGGDLKSMADPQTVESHAGALIQELANSVELLHGMPAPTFAVLSGTAAGGGLSLALACDIVLCADAARLVPAYGTLGACPDGGMTWQLARRTSWRWATDFLLLSDGILGEAAAAAGLVTQSAKLSDFDTAESALRERLLAQSPAAVLATRQLLAAASGRTLTSQLAAEKRLFLELARTPAFTERVAMRMRR